MVDDQSDRDEARREPDGVEDDSAVDGEWEPIAERERAVAPNGDGTDDVPDPRDGPIAALQWVLATDVGVVVFLREIVGSAIAVLLVGMLLFGVSGVWPPMVAIESGSMQPHLEKGDLVFVMEEHRFAPDIATGETGVVPYDVAKEAGYEKFGSYGDVIIYHPYGDPNRKPVIHRARFWVEKGEDWTDKADPAYLSTSDCDSIPNCPAPHAGFITKGDNAETNNYYDQTKGISDPVKPSWISGTAEVRIPWLGWVRLTFSDVQTGGDLTPLANQPW